VLNSWPSIPGASKVSKARRIRAGAMEQVAEKKTADVSICRLAN